MTGVVPSVELVRRLCELDRSALDFEEQLSAVAAWERVLSWVQCRQDEVLADIDRDERLAAPGWGAQPSARWVAEQVGVALGVSGPSAQRRMSTAATLIEKLPAVTAALRVGGITVHHARIAAVNANVLETEVARAVDAAVMADPDWRTPSQLERTFARIVREVDPAGAAVRHERARRHRRVSLRAEPDGMCGLWALLSAEQGQLVNTTIDAYARSSAATNSLGDRRTLDERRADALVELVTREPGGPATGDQGGSGSPRVHGRRPQIHVTVAWSTLLGLDDAPADLAGYGPIDAATARRIGSDPESVWRRLIVDPVSGRLLDYGATTYRPPQDLTDFVIARDRYCRFPTCDRPAVSCEQDHRTPFGTPGGDTAAGNVDALCTRHHRLKHNAGWTHDRDPDTGDSLWTDPLGNLQVKPSTRLPTPAAVEPPDDLEPCHPELGDPPF